MGTAILKAGGMATVLVGGAFALFQANTAVEGSLAAAAVLRTPDDGLDDFGENLDGPGGDPGADASWFDLPEAAPAPATEPPAPFLDGAGGDDPLPTFDDAPLRHEPAAAQPPEQPRRIEFDPAPGAAASPASHDFDFNSSADPPTAEPSRPVPPAARVAEPEPAALPDLVEFDDRRPAAAAVQLRVRKAAPAEARPGESFVYTIVVANAGGTAARGVTVEEPVPAGVRLEGTDPRADLDGRTLRWSLGDLPPGGERQLSVKVVPTAAGAVGSVTSVRCDLSAATRTAVLAPRLSVVAGAIGSPRAGRPFDLRLLVENVGTADAPNAAVRTLLPPGVEHASGERDLVYDLGTMKSGQRREVTLTVSADAPGPARFQCELTGVGAAQAAAATVVDVGRRQLTLTRNGPRTRFVGRTGAYKNVVTNASDAPAPAVRVIESVPDGFSFASATAGGRYDADARVVLWDVPALAPGRSATLEVELKAEAAGQAESVVVLESDGHAEAELVSATALRGYTAVAPRIGGLNGPLAVGERVAILVTLQNTGTDVAAGLHADVNLPPSVRALLYAGGGLDAVDTDRGVRLTPTKPLAPGETITGEVLIEGVSAGGGAIELSVSADHLTEPATRSEPVRVYADAE